MRPDRLVAPALGALWSQRGRLSFAWDVLRNGACSDCSLGASGLASTAPGRHLCSRRLARLDRETAPPFSPDVLSDPRVLEGLPARALRALGRLPVPLLRRGLGGFEPVSWEDASNFAAARLRDARGEARATVRVDPHGLDLETLFQVGRVVAGLERRREGPPILDLAVPASERRLRRLARERLGHASSSASSVEFGPGDRALVVSDGDQPLLPDLVASLIGRGVLVVEAGPDDPWPDDVRQTLVFGRSGTTAALAAGLPLAPETPGTDGVSAVCFVGDQAARWTPGWEAVPARIHVASFLDPAMLAPAPEAVLLLPAAPNASLPAGGSHLGDDLVVRFSPRVLGGPPPGGRPAWQVLCSIGAMADEDLGARLAVDDASELRAALAAARPGLAGLLEFGRAGDAFRLPQPVP